MLCKTAGDGCANPAGVSAGVAKGALGGRPSVRVEAGAAACIVRGRRRERRPVFVDGGCLRGGVMSRCLAFLAVVAFLVYQPSAFANVYERGYILCDDFQRIAGRYKTTPTESNYAVAYAGCLLARNAGDDIRAISILEAEASKGNVGAAYWLAMYTSTGGTMEIKKRDSNSYEEAFHAYGQVIHLINQKVNYPKGELHPEYAHQYELHSYSNLVLFSYLKFLDGLAGSDNSYLLQSASYTGDRNLNLYPKYSPYTLHNLEQVIENAQICANLPQKRHFEKLLYYRVTFHCRMMLDFAQRMLPLERKRLTLLNNLSCARDTEICSEYQEVVFSQIIPLIKDRKKQEKRIRNMELAALKAAMAGE